jgi:hypothetical protein
MHWNMVSHVLSFPYAQDKGGLPRGCGVFQLSAGTHG